MAADLLALLSGFDNAFVVIYAIKERLRRDVPLEVFVYSQRTFNCVAKDVATFDRPLQLDVAALHESHSGREIRCIGWLSGQLNATEDLTRALMPKPEHALLKLILKTRMMWTWREGLNSSITIDGFDENSQDERKYLRVFLQ